MGGFCEIFVVGANARDFGDVDLFLIDDGTSSFYQAFAIYQAGIKYLLWLNF